MRDARNEMKRQALLKHIIENYELDHAQKKEIKEYDLNELQEWIGPAIAVGRTAAPTVARIGGKVASKVKDYVTSGKFTNDGLATAIGAVTADGMNKAAQEPAPEKTVTPNPTTLDLADNKPKTTWNPTKKFSGKPEATTGDLGKDVDALLAGKKPEAEKVSSTSAATEKPVVGPDSQIAQDVDKALRFGKPVVGPGSEIGKEVDKALNFNKPDTAPAASAVSSNSASSSTTEKKPGFKFNSKKGGIVSKDELSSFRKHVGNENATLGQYMNSRDGKTAIKGGANDPSVIEKKTGKKPYIPESLINAIGSFQTSQNPFSSAKQLAAKQLAEQKEIQEAVKGLDKLFPDHHKVLAKHGYEPTAWNSSKVGEVGDRHNATFEHKNGHRVSLFSEPDLLKKGGEHTVGWSVSEKLGGKLERFKARHTGSWEGTDKHFTHYDSDYGLDPKKRFDSFRDTLDAIHEDGDKKKVNEELEVAEGYMIKRVGPSKNPKQPKFGKKTFRPEMTDKGKHADTVAKAHGYTYSHHSYLDDPKNPNMGVKEKLVNHHYEHKDGHKLVIQCGDPSKEKVEFETKGTGLRKLRREKNNVFKQVTPEPKWIHTHVDGEKQKTFESKDAPAPSAERKEKSPLLSHSAIKLEDHLGKFKVNEEVVNKAKKEDRLDAKPVVEVPKPDTSKTGTRWQVTKKFDAQNAAANEEVKLSDGELEHIEKILGNKGE